MRLHRCGHWHRAQSRLIAASGKAISGAIGSGGQGQGSCGECGCGGQASLPPVHRLDAPFTAYPQNRNTGHGCPVNRQAEMPDPHLFACHFQSHLAISVTTPFCGSRLEKADPLGTPSHPPRYLGGYTVQNLTGCSTNRQLGLPHANRSAHHRGDEDRG